MPLYQDGTAARRLYGRLVVMTNFLVGQGIRCSRNNCHRRMSPDDADRTRLRTMSIRPPGATQSPRTNTILASSARVPAGLLTARAAAALGAKVALIERDLIGGDCLNVGCVPSKAIIRTARLYAEMRDAENFGAQVPSGIGIDFPAVMERMRRVRARLSRRDSARRLSAAGVDVYFGEARFAGPRRDRGGRRRRCASRRR